MGTWWQGILHDWPKDRPWERRGLLQSVLVGAGIGLAATFGEPESGAGHRRRKRRRKRCRQRCNGNRQTCDLGCDILDGDSREFCKQGCKVAHSQCRNEC